MTKSKKANLAAARGTRGGHLLGPPRAANGTARATKSNGTPVSTPAKREPAPSKEPATTLALAAECTVADAASLKESLAALLDQPLPVTLDVTALQRIDTAGLQVISAFIRERAGNGRPVEWRGTAPVLTNAAQLLGLTSLLGLPA
jgi:ABC-type transporter Mla MlaB component